jgi:hypothetical protein
MIYGANKIRLSPAAATAGARSREEAAWPMTTN